MKTAIIYRRISDKDKQGDGFSLDYQEDYGKQYAGLIGANVVRVFTDKQTAKEAGRDQFGAMVQFIRSSRIPIHLIVQETDRLYRNFEDHVVIKALMKEKDLNIHFFKEGEVLGREANSYKKVMHGFKILMAEFYVNLLGEKVSNGMKKAVELGHFPFRPPYGYSKIDKLLVPNPEEAPFVRRAFELYSTGMYPLSELENTLFQEGLIYKPAEPRIGRSRLHLLLQSKVYTGHMEVYGQLWKGRHDPLISMETWLAAQDVMKKKAKGKTRQKRDFLYRGLLTCGDCGKRLVGENKKGGRYVYYACSDRQRGCNPKYISEEAVQRAIEVTIQDLNFPSDYRPAVLQAVKELESFREFTSTDETRKVMDQIQKLKKNLAKAWQEKQEGILDQEIYETVTQDYQHRILVLEGKLSKINQADLNYYQMADRLLELPERLKRNWFKADPEQKKKLLNLVCSNFLFKDRKLLVELKEPFSLFTSTNVGQEWWAKPDILRNLIILHRETIDRLYAA